MQGVAPYAVLSGAFAHREARLGVVGHGWSSLGWPSQGKDRYGLRMQGVASRMGRNPVRSRIVGRGKARLMPGQERHGLVRRAGVRQGLRMQRVTSLNATLFGVLVRAVRLGRDRHG
jgi:hypothetical protein